MRIAVAGGAGFIGRHLVERLVADGHDVTASWFNRKNPDVNAKWRQCDLTRQEYADLFVKDAELVYICAGETAGAGVVAKTRRALVIPTLQLHISLFEACARAGVKHVIAMSSSTGYPDSDKPMKETDYHGELFPAYRHIGATKRFVETLGQMYEEMSVTFLRATNVYGPHDCYDLERSHVVPALVRKVAERLDPFVVWGDGGEVRDMIYISDVVNALVLAQKSTGHESFNIGYGEGHSVKEMLESLFRIADHFPEVVYDASKPQMIRKRAVDTRKAFDKLDFIPTVGINEGLFLTYEWAKANL